MAVNILLGAPGSGKSYEAVAFHVLPALAAGRKVITNLPLDLEEFRQLDPAYPALIEKREGTRAVRPEFDAQKAESLFKKFGIAARQEYFNAAAFSHVEDYGDKWRHADTGTGPLYVVDECHLALPSKATPRAVEEWFSLHRHESADVLLITQSHSKINRAVVELVQTCYRVRKNTALGSSNSYRRAVLDGVRGEQANFSIRKYHPQYFALYKSYTRGGGQEQAASDIVPIWKRPIFILMFVSFIVTAVLVARSANPLSLGAGAKPAKVSSGAVSAPVPAVSADALQASPIPASAVQDNRTKSVDHALSTYQLHQVGEIVLDGATRLFYRLSRQGSVMFDLDSRQLVTMGYQVVRLEKCFSHVSHSSGWSVYASCDSPSQGFGMPGHSQPGATGEGPATAGGATGSAVPPKPSAVPSAPFKQAALQ